jgi:hypothetical protein
MRVKSGFSAEQLMGRAFRVPLSVFEISDVTLTLRSELVKCANTWRSNSTTPKGSSSLAQECGRMRKETSKRFFTSAWMSIPSMSPGEPSVRRGRSCARGDGDAEHFIGKYPVRRTIAPKCAGSATAMWRGALTGRVGDGLYQVGIR